MITEDDIEEAMRIMDGVNVLITIEKILSPHKYKSTRVLKRPPIPVHDDSDEYINGIFWTEYLCEKDFTKFYNKVSSNYYKSFDDRESLKLQIITLLRLNKINIILK